MAKHSYLQLTVAKNSNCKLQNPQNGTRTFLSLHSETQQTNLWHCLLTNFTVTLKTLMENSDKCITHKAFFGSLEMS